MKAEIIAGTICLGVCFAAGRYSVKTPPAQVITVTKIVEVQKEQETKKDTVIVKRPDGTETTTITEDTKTKTDEVQRVDAHTEITPTPRKTLNLSALAGIDLRNGYGRVYGASVTKEVLGPITIGIWGLTNGTAGVSVGVSF